MKNNSEFAKEFLKEWNDPKKSKKSLGKAIGLPDKEDEAFLMKLIKDYEAENPGWLQFMRDEARKQFEAGRYGSVFNENSKVNKDSNMTYDFEFPPSFFKKIESHYPLMFRDVEHYRWFKKTFAALMIRPNQYRAPKRK